MFAAAVGTQNSLISPARRSGRRGSLVRACPEEPCWRPQAAPRSSRRHPGPPGRTTARRRRPPAGRRLLARRPLDGLAPQRGRHPAHPRPRIGGGTRPPPLRHRHPRPGLPLHPLLGHRLAADRRHLLAGRRRAGRTLSAPALQPPWPLSARLGRARHPRQRGTHDHRHDDEPRPARLRRPGDRRNRLPGRGRGTRAHHPAPPPAPGRVPPARLRPGPGHRHPHRPEHGPGLQPHVGLGPRPGLGRLRLHHHVPAHRRRRVPRHRTRTRRLRGAGARPGPRPRLGLPGPAAAVRHQGRLRRGGDGLRAARPGRRHAVPDLPHHELHARRGRGGPLHPQPPRRGRRRDLPSPTPTTTFSRRSCACCAPATWTGRSTCRRSDPPPAVTCPRSSGTPPGSPTGPR